MHSSLSRKNCCKQSSAAQVLVRCTGQGVVRHAPPRHWPSHGNTCSLSALCSLQLEVQLCGSIMFLHVITFGYKLGGQNEVKLDLGPPAGPGSSGASIQSNCHSTTKGGLDRLHSISWQVGETLVRVPGWLLLPSAMAWHAILLQMLMYLLLTLRTVALAS
jgi:hypothetical protein